MKKTMSTFEKFFMRFSLMMIATGTIGLLFKLPWVSVFNALLMTLVLTMFVMFGEYWIER